MYEQSRSRIIPEYKPHIAWDAPTRLLHWINALAVLGLIGTGLVIMNDDALGLSSAGKILLKSLHASFGYALAIGLLLRIIWAFFGNRHARWGGILPGGAGYFASLREYVRALLSRNPQQFIGHNPLAKMAVTVLFALLLIQAATGLVIAGTDLYWPPFGQWFVEWVAAPGVNPATVQPGVAGLVNKTSYDALRAFRAPIVEIHELVFYGLAFAITLHIIGVVVTELHEGGGIVSAMFTGRKILTKKPMDAKE